MPNMSVIEHDFETLKEAGFELFPLRPGSKLPRDKGWATADYSNFDSAAHSAAGGNVGVRLKPGQVVLDIDPRNGGDAGGYALELDFGEALARCPRVRTGGGGEHIYAAGPAGERLLGRVPGYPGIDVKTAGGFVVAPGSIHPDTGKPYVVTKPFGRRVPTLPKRLAERLVRRAAPARTGEEGVMTPDELAVLLGALDPESFGKGHHDGFVALMAAAHDATGGDGRDVFLEWAARDDEYGAAASGQNGYRWDSFTAGERGGVTYKTLLKFVADAGRRDLVAQFDSSGAADDFEDDEPSSSDTGRKAARYKRLTIGEIAALDPPRWLVGQLIPEGGLVQLYGPRKTGKTFLALDMALRVALGLPYHGHTAARGRVTYVIAEGGAARFADRVLAWCKHNGVAASDLERDFDVVPVRVGVDNKADLTDFLREDREPRALIVFDTLARNMDGDENSTHDMNVAIKGLDKVRERTGAAVLVVHHSGKDEARQGRGSTALPGAVDATLKVFKNKTDGRTILLLEESRNAAAGIALSFDPVSVVLDGDLDRSSLVMAFAGDARGNQPSTAADKVLLLIVKQDGVLDRSKLVNPGEEGLSKANVNKAIRALKEDGLIEGDGPIFPTLEGRKRARMFGTADEFEEDE